MEIQIRYGSRTGNTKKIADAMAEAAGIKALPASEPLTGRVDLLFIGSGIYAGQVDPSVMTLVDSLEKGWVGLVALFSTAAGNTSAETKLRRVLTDKGIQVASSAFHCKGKFLLANRNRPNEEDLQAAAAFAVMQVRGLNG